MWYNSLMKIAVIIAEFNPFHNGHEYIINQAKELTDCTHVLIVQSGNFTQRAEPAIIDKHIRAKSAIMCGADAVIEIPSAYATGNAEVFAKAGVQLANAFPHVSYLVFGTEDNNLELLQKIALVKLKYGKEFDKYIKQHLKLGLSFEAAQAEVIKKLLPQIQPNIITKILNGGNNILAIEYIRELYRLKSKITPVPVKRMKKDYTSALSIRTAVYEKTMPFENYIPEKILPLTITGLSNHPQKDLYESSALFGALTGLDEKTTYNANEELSNLFKNNRPVTFAEMGNVLPTRRYSISRIKRLALHSTIGVTKNDIKFLYKNNYLPYTNLLAIRATADNMFAELCSVINTPVIVRGNRNKPKVTNYYTRMKEIDHMATSLYEIACKQKFASKPVFVK